MPRSRPLVFRGYIRRMEKTMEPNVVSWGYISTMELNNENYDYYGEQWFLVTRVITLEFYLPCNKTSVLLKRTSWRLCGKERFLFSV